MSGFIIRKSSIEQNRKKSWFFAPLLARASAPHRLENMRNGRVVADRVVGAFDSKSRRIGLLRHTEFAPGHALVIAPCNGIHTWFMKFAIDVAFVSKDGRIVKIRKVVPPWRIAFALFAHAVIELPAGTLDACETRVGDTVAVVALV